MDDPLANCVLEEICAVCGVVVDTLSESLATERCPVCPVCEAELDVIESLSIEVDISFADSDGDEDDPALVVGDV